jgi:hypothetical protein
MTESVVTAIAAHGLSRIARDLRLVDHEDTHS